MTRSLTAKPRAAATVPRKRLPSLRSLILQLERERDQIVKTPFGAARADYFLASDAWPRLLARVRQIQTHHGKPFTKGHDSRRANTAVPA